MKPFHIILITFVLALFSCQPSSSTDTKDDTVIEDATAKQWLNFEGNDNKPNIVLISGDEEYRSEEALPQLAKILSTHHGFNCTVLFAQDPEHPGIVDPNYRSNIPGLESLGNADLMIIFTRFRSLPDEQMQFIDNYLKNGKPVIGLRTATHAFKFNDAEFETQFANYGNYYNADDEWKDGFGRVILGEKWISHHGKHKHQSTAGIPAPGKENHPILTGINGGNIWGPTDVYGVRLPLPDDSEPIVLGQVINRAGEYDENDPLYGMKLTDSEAATSKMIQDENGQEKEINPNDPMMPVAWIKSYQVPNGEKGKVFATTMGASTDLLAEGTRRMLINAAYWCLELPVPEEANVNLIGDYTPSAFVKKDDQYWDEKALKIENLK